MALTEEQEARFWEDGYLMYGNILSAEEVGALKQQSEDIATGGLTHLPERYIQVEPAIQRGDVTADSRLNSIRKMKTTHYFQGRFHAT